MIYKMQRYGFIADFRLPTRKITAFFSIACERRVENGRFCVSLTSDGQKLGYSAFRLRATGRNWVILRFACERRAENGRFCVSLASDGQKTGDSAFRRPTKSRFCCFFRFVGRRQPIFIVFCISSADDGRFSGHFCFSKDGETQKMDVFDFPQGGESRFFPFFDDSVHRICSFQRFLMIPSTEFAVFAVF